MNLLDYLRRIFGQRDGHEAELNMPMMLKMIAITDEKEIACDEVYALIDQFTEMAARGEDVSRLMPLVKKHLDLCPDCREDYEALLNILKALKEQRGSS